jgi:hypothetical protein
VRLRRRHPTCRVLPFRARVVANSPRRSGNVVVVVDFVDFVAIAIAFAIAVVAAAVAMAPLALLSRFAPIGRGATVRCWAVHRRMSLSPPWRDTIA